MDLFQENVNGVSCYTETCVTDTLLPSVTSQTRRNGLYSCLSATSDPRQNSVRKASHFRGEPGGVLIASSYPARPSNIPVPWASWCSTRIAECLVSLPNNLVIRIIGFYGHPNKKPSSLRRNDALLQSLDAFLESSLIPTVFLGDFNVDISKLEWWQRLYQRGWRDAADLFFRMTGCEPQPTWNHKSRIDFILLPPQLVQFFKRLQVSADTISDHARVTASLFLPDTPISILVWKTCLDSSSLDMTGGGDALSHMEVDFSYVQTCVRDQDVDELYNWICDVFNRLLGRIAVMQNRAPGPFFGRKQAIKIQKDLYPPRINQADKESLTPR